MAVAMQPRVNIIKRDDKSLILTSPYQAGILPRNLADVFVNKASEQPDALLIAEKSVEGQWQTLSYGQALAHSKSIAQWLLDRQGIDKSPLMILTGASIQHFLMSWGALLARIPYVPVSTAYTSIPAAYPKLRAVFERTQPGLVFAASFDSVWPALVETSIAEEPLVYMGKSRADAISFEKMVATVVTADVADSIALINHETVARYIFTSGSTGMPKGVIHNHGMVCQMLASRQALREDDADEPPRYLDWMPWSHVGAGVLRLASIMAAGGSIYLDDGKPVPGQHHKTLENLAQVKPTSYAGAPLGWAMLVDVLERDSDLAGVFFANIKSMAFGSAAMPVSLFERIQALVVRFKGQRMPMSTALMSTEVACGLSWYWDCDNQEVIGLPMPGAEFKLIPVANRFEIRVRSKGVTPGYINDPDKTAAAFDEEGFFKMGDAVSFLDPAEPAKGLCFAGRVAEQFKLQSGTWVLAGTLRAELIAACSPWVRDVVICGLNQSYVTAMLWLNQAACADAVGREDDAELTIEELVTSDVLRALIREKLGRHNLQHSGSSKRIQRFILLSEPASLGDGEITEKGYVNQGAVQARRADIVTALYARPGGAVVLV
ncbi:MAG: AMP-binding protein [Gammaproteobacteria bacterium]|nr:AMP-binding protein [Gammaproteobacteria bacterium]